MAAAGVHPPPPTRFGPTATPAATPAVAGPAAVQRMEYAGNLLQSGWSAVKSNPLPYIVGGLIVAGTTALGVWYTRKREQERQAAWRQETFGKFLAATHMSEDDYLGDEEQFAPLWDTFVNKTVLSEAAAQVIERRGGRSPRQLMDDFVGRARRRNFVYDPNGADCESIAKTFLDVVGRGKTRYIGSSAVGNVRVLVRIVRPIDERWQGGRVLTPDRGRIAGWVGFQNHWAVEVDGVIYDPTGGYVGAEDGWCRLLTRSEGENYDLDQPLPGRTERHAEVTEEATGKVTRLRD